AHRDPRLRGTYASGGASGRQLSHYFGRKAEYIDFEKSGAIFGPPARQVVDHPQDDRPGLAAVAGDRGELVEDGAVHLDLLRLGEVELGRVGLDRHQVVVVDPEAVPGADGVVGVEADDAE